MATSYLAHHVALLAQLRAVLADVGAAEQVPSENHALFLDRFDDLLSQIFSRYPQIAHRVPRDLLWFFGGDCLHFMPDEELALYQRLDERRHEAESRGEAFDWAQEQRLMALPDDAARH